MDASRANGLGSCAMDTAIALVELAVGLGCIAGGVGTFRMGGSRVLGVVLLIAGVAAAGHALVAFAGN